MLWYNPLPLLCIWLSFRLRPVQSLVRRPSLLTIETHFHGKRTMTKRKVTEEAQKQKYSTESEPQSKRSLRSDTKGKEEEGKYLFGQGRSTPRRQYTTPRKKRRHTISDPETKFHEVRNEANRGIVELLNEMSDLYFVIHHDERGTAKSIRETEREVKSGEFAQHFRGIGEHISSYIEEFIETGHVKHLDELREEAKGSKTSSGEMTSKA